MLRLIPPPLHRAAYRLAHRLRRTWWSIRKPSVEGAAVVATDLEGRLLLVRLSYGSGGWNLPTGGVKRGEDAHSAAAREFFEETGCKAHNLKPLGVQEEALSGAANRVHVFSARVSGSPEPDMREVVEARLFPMHSLPEPLTAATRRRLALFREVSEQR